ncbi:hypothetical protein D3C85_401260 [compost metagenome]
MNLGIFSTFWDGNPNHLPFLSLLQLPDDESQNFNLTLSFAKLEDILESNTVQSIYKGIKLLLNQENWIMHLVTAVSLLFIKQSTRESVNDLFWERLSRGIWFSPQILVALSKCDPSYDEKAGKILIEGLKISYAPLTAVDHHIARGVPAAVFENKTIAATNYLLHNVIEDNADNDYGTSLAQNWQEKLHQLQKENKLKFEIS